MSYGISRQVDIKTSLEKIYKAFKHLTCPAATLSGSSANKKLTNALDAFRIAR